MFSQIIDNPRQHLCACQEPLPTHIGDVSQFKLMPARSMSNAHGTLSIMPTMPPTHVKGLGASKHLPLLKVSLKLFIYW